MFSLALLCGCSTKVSMSKQGTDLLGKNIAVISTERTEYNRITDFYMIFVLGEHKLDMAPRLEESMINADMFNIVDRSHINKILEEKKLMATDLADTGNVIEVGKLAGVDAIMTVQSAHWWWWLVPGAANIMECSVRIIDVNTGNVVGTANSKYTLPTLIAGWWWMFDFPGDIADEITAEMKSKATVNEDVH